MIWQKNMHYTCIACVTIDFVINIDKKSHPQVSLGECKYRLKKLQMSRFTNTKPMSDSEPSDTDSDSEKIETKFDAELMTKLEKSDSDILLLMNFAHTFLLTLNRPFYCWRQN